MRINYKKIFNLRKLLSDPKKLFSVLIFTLVVVFIQNYIAQNSSFEGKVVRIIDGDTIEVNHENKLARIRFFGIDAPELKKLFEVDINRFLVSKGYAWADTYYSNAYIKEQENAKKNHLGLWKESNPIEPYKWRKHNKF
ncbi:thermonuclease family protein [Campylobacter jejuni]|uniref:thermonuclease family protein n=1 Tax=Campylobacter jejuni TaxID=197 RepID=UPI0007079A6A|nr:thermonuclease family protein [Campylobacter jejuni]KQI58207.1 nuclease [Campylobacter jejuni CVM 41974]